MKNKNCIIGLISAVVVLAATVTAIIVFRREIGDLFCSVKGKLTSCKNKFTPEECEDFADI